MKVILFGATGMVGQGVLRECLQAADVDAVLAVGRSPTGLVHPKLRETVVPDLFDHEAAAAEWSDFDACFFCLGVSSAGMTETAYTHITRDLTLAIAQSLNRRNRQMTFVYVSGAHTDASERGRSMWARVKGQTENALRRLPFRAVYLFRPGLIRPLDGIRSKTPAYRLFYTLAGPLLPLVHRLFPRSVVSTADIGRAMLTVARRDQPNPVLEAADIAAAAWVPAPAELTA